MTKKYARRGKDPYARGGLWHGGGGKPTPCRQSDSTPESIRSEHQEQANFYTWIENNSAVAPELTRFRAIPNGGWRGEKVEYERKDGSRGQYSPTGVRMRREGVKPGTLDNLNPVARRGYHSLWLEFKVGKNDLDDTPENRWDQVRERRALIEEGHCVHTVWNWIEAAHVSIWYFDLGNTPLWMPWRHSPMPVSGHDERCRCDYLRLSELPWLAEESWLKRAA